MAIVVAAALFAGCASTEANPDPNATDAQKAFARLKLLVGRWNGKIAGAPETAPTPPSPEPAPTPPANPEAGGEHLSKEAHLEEGAAAAHPEQEAGAAAPAIEPKVDTVPVEYAVTSGGHVLQEKLFAGTKEEVVTLYYLEGEGLALIRDRSIGSRGHMRLDVANSTRDDLRFEFDGTATDVDPKKESHVHRGRIHFVDADTIECEWTLWADGKESHTSEYTLSRASGGFTPLPK